MAFPPEAFLIGAQKAGTTTLAYLLGQHPRITVSTPKEPDFFSRNWGLGPEWYRTVFRGDPSNILLDASTSYSAAPVEREGREKGETADPLRHVPARIHAVSPQAQFIYVLRDPVTRTYSSYWHRVRAKEETRPFREAIRAESFYLRTSDYGAQLEVYLKYFPLTSFLLIVFEEFSEDPAAAMQRCFGFLGAQPADFPVRLEAAKNQSYVNTAFGEGLARLFPATATMKALTRVCRAIVPRPFHSLLRRAISKEIPRMREEDRAFLVDYFRRRNQRLVELTGISIARWQR